MTSFQCPIVCLDIFHKSLRKSDPRTGTDDAEHFYTVRVLADLPIMSDAQEWRQNRRAQLSREEYERLWRESRLSLPPMVRIPGAALAAFGLGFTLGIAHGSQMAGLRFRAEHAHKLPTTTTGWYLYHKSKNYHLMFGGLKEGFRNGMRLSLITSSIFLTENLFDVYRGSKDMFNTIAASLAVASGFSIISTLTLLLRQ